MQKKSTTIIAESGLDVKDKSNLDSFSEKTIKQFNVDLEKIKFDHLKPIVKDWYPEIIKTIFNLISKDLDYNFDKKSKTFTVIFNSNDDCINFYNTFNRNVHKGLNKFLLDKGENVKHYNRILVFETKQENQILQIRF